MAESGYYDNDRADVAALVPPVSRVILDVGCGRGRLGQLLKSMNRDRKVCGVELDAGVASAARAVLDSVVWGDFQTLDLPPDWRGVFDCIIFADVLEHLIDPAAALRKVRPLLAPDGIIVCSIPNIRHYTAFLRLALHGWEYADYGLFDRTHLRFFSLRSMDQLLTQAGYRVFQREPRIIASVKMRILNTLCFGHLEEFLAQQYILLARPVS